jgi:phage-related holin
MILTKAQMDITNKWLYIAAYIALAALTGYIFGGVSFAFTSVCILVFSFATGVLAALAVLKAIEKFFSQH